MSKKFWKYFNHEKFDEAINAFGALPKKTKQEIFAELFQKSQYHTKPTSISVLFRELHPKKSFKDFYKAWLPKKKYRTIKKIRGQTFHHFFEAPIRVINAIKGKEVVSIGLHWATDKQINHELKRTKIDPSRNQSRADAIAKVATKTHQKIYKVKSDVNLGTPFQSLD